MWLIVSSLSSYNQYLLFCCILSILALTLFVLMALFCSTLRRDSDSFLMFPFFSHVQVFSSEISLVCRLKCPYSCFSSHFYYLIIFVLLIRLLSLLLVAVISLPFRFYYYCHYYFYYYYYLIFSFIFSVLQSFTGSLRKTLSERALIICIICIHDF